MIKVRRIAHVAILVEQMDMALGFWRDTLGIEIGYLEDIPAEGAKVGFLPVGDSELELLEPMCRDSRLGRYLEKRGPCLHHICLEVDDIEGVLVELRRRGVRLLDESPSEASGGKRYAFIHPQAANGVLVELYEAADRGSNTGRAVSGSTGPSKRA
jgi:methylmalonyl-CoA/ethylmalonyl-CoA epimerase